MNELMQSKVKLNIQKLTKNLVDDTTLELNNVEFVGNVFALTEFIAVLIQEGQSTLGDEAFQELLSTFLSENENEVTNQDMDIAELVPVKTQRGKERPMESAIEVNSETELFDSYPTDMSDLREEPENKRRLGS